MHKYKCFVVPVLFFSASELSFDIVFCSAVVNSGLDTWICLQYGSAIDMNVVISYNNFGRDMMTDLVISMSSCKGYYIFAKFEN